MCHQETAGRQLFNKYIESFKQFALISIGGEVDYSEAVIGCATVDHFKVLETENISSQGPDPNKIQNLYIAGNVAMMNIKKEVIIERLARINKPDIIHELERIINQGCVGVIILTEEGVTFDEIDPFATGRNKLSSVQ